MFWMLIRIRLKYWFDRIDIFIQSISYSFKTMVVGSIEERIKKMKEAIQNEAKQRALYIVEKAEE